MGLPLLQRVMATVLLISCFAVRPASSWIHSLPIADRGPAAEVCPPCELLFSKLEYADGGSGKLSQDIKVQVRGEPKSGTGFMYFWATATLLRTCRYLQDLFGEESCWVEFNPGEETDDDVLGRSFNRTMIFQPARAAMGARCSCNTIDRVSIILSKFHKHTLPVSTSCAYSHGGGMDLVIVERQLGKSACTFADGSKVENREDLWRCMHTANCEITDDWIQMTIFRDPRPAVVSSYYHREIQGSKHLGELEAFVARELPILCQWLAIRFILFTGLIPDQSMAFWYDDAISDPLEWHYHWFNSVGLQLPPSVVQRATAEAVADNLGFPHKTIDVHRGEEPRTEMAVHRFEDEVAPEIAAAADAVLRVWLPPVLLEKFGISP